MNQDLNNSFDNFKFIEGTHKMEVENDLYEKNKTICKLRTENTEAKRYAME